MAELTLTPKERQALKGRAHALDPVVLLGAGGLSPAVLREIDRALTAHALIKVRVPGDDRAEREAIFRQVADALSAARVQAIGKLLVFFRPQPQEAAVPAASEPTVGPKRPLPGVPKKAAAHRTAAQAAARPRIAAAAQTRPARPPQRGKPEHGQIRQQRRQAPRRAAGRRPAGPGRR